MKRERPDTSKLHRRNVALGATARGAGKAPTVGEDRRLTLSFSSEQPVERWFGDEILSHADGAPDFSRLNDGAPLLWGHDTNAIIGVVERAWVDKGRGMATVRFASNADGNEFMAMVNDGVVRNVSFAYQVTSYRADGSGAPASEEIPTYTATSWLAYEISLVSVPADQSIGVGRQFNSEELNMDREEPSNPESRSARRRAAVEGFSTGRETGEREGRAAESERIRSILEMGRRFGCGDLANELVEDGCSIQEAQAAVMARMDRNPQRPIASTPRGSNFEEIGISPREVAGYSLVRAINAAIKGDWAGAGFEREVSVTMQKRAGKSSAGFMLPSDLLARAPYAVGGATTGGNLVATNLLSGSFIEILRNQTVTGKLGAQFLTGLVGKVAIPRRSAASSTYWVAESGAVTESEATFDQVTLSPKTIGSLSKMSRLTLLQTTPDIEMLTRNDFIAQLALGIDLAALSGSGAANQPTGIVNTSGVGSVVGGTNGLNLGFDEIIKMYSQPLVSNSPQANLAFALNAKSYGYLSTIKATTGQYLWNPGGGIFGAPADTLRGYPYAVSNQLRSNLTKGTSVGICFELIFGNWQELLIGEWGAIEVLVNPYDSTGFTNGDVLIRALQTIDIGVRHAASFSVYSDALTPGF